MNNELSMDIAEEIKRVGIRAFLESLAYCIEEDLGKGDK